MKKILSVFLILVFIGSVSATTITDEDVSIDLENSRVNISMDVTEMTSSAFYYTSSFPVNNDFEARIDGEPADCNKEPLPPGSYVTCNVNSSDFKVNFVYTTQGLVTERNGVNIFRYTQSIQRPTDSYNLKVFLPSGTGLIDESNVSLPVISPEDGFSGTDGQRIFVEWDKNPSLGQLSFQTIYTPVSDQGSEGPDLVWILPLIIGSLIGGVIYLFFSMRENLDEAYEDISQDGKDILDTIRENDNSMLQKDIVDNSEYSKAKISSVISELEEKGIVNKSKEGRSNKISIARKYKY